MRRDSMNHVINASINQTRPDRDHPARRCSPRSRCFLFGGEVLHGFAFTMRRHHHRHLLERLHRRGDRQPVAGGCPDTRRRSRPGHRRRGAGAAAAAETEASAKGTGFLTFESLKSEV
jgi:hypothetical protein